MQYCAYFQRESIFKKRGSVVGTSAVYSMESVSPAEAEEVRHVLIVERVVDGSPLPPSAHEMEHPQHPKVMRRGRLACTEELRKIVHAQLGLR